MPEGNGPKRGFDIFSAADDVQINRLGKNVMVRTKDGSFTESNTAEANLLYEILKVLKKQK